MCFTEQNVCVGLRASRGLRHEDWSWRLFGVLAVGIQGAPWGSGFTGADATASTPKGYIARAAESVLQRT